MINLPLRLLLAVTLAFFLSHTFSEYAVSVFYTLSICLKDILMLILPFMVFSYLASSIFSLQGQAILMVFSVFGLVIISNAITVLTAYFSAQGIFYFLKPAAFKMLESTQNHGINPLWRLPNLEFLTADKAMLLGVFIGFFVLFTKLPAIEKAVLITKKTTTKILNTAFIPFLPLYVFGFVLKIGFEGTFKTLATTYAPIFFLSLILIHSYLFFWYVAGCGGNIRCTLDSIKNMIPAWVTGFSTMSSAATLPVTLKCVQHNTKNSDFTNFVVPATANVHMIGDGLNITLTALALLVMSGHPLPSFFEFLPYIAAYVITKFSGSGIPGGGMFILLPVVERHLGLSSELCSIVATLYVLQDSLMTASNVAGNGAFALVAKKLFTKSFSKTIQTAELSGF